MAGLAPSSGRLPAGACLVAAAVWLAGACAGTGGAQWTYAPSESGVSAGASAPAPSTPAAEPSATSPSPSADASGDPGPAASTIEIRAFDLGFEPKVVTVPAAGRYEVSLANEGSIVHDLTAEGQEPITAEAGQTATGTLEVPATGLAFICSIPGHAPAGMTGEVRVAGAAQATPGESPGASPGESPVSEDHSGPAPAVSVQEDPNAPPPVTLDPAAPARLAGETHEVELRIAEREMTVAPGFVQRVWMFGESVPGPVIRVKVGDRIRVRLVNPAGNELPHSIDFHSSMVAWNDEMTSINPGEEKIYEWDAVKAGVWMYHCGTTPTLHHIANGMYGMVIVEPRQGLDPVAHEYALVQSEWYLGPQGDIVSLEKASHSAPDPDFVVFNGVKDQYKDAPIEVPTGERVRVYVLNAGPNVDSSFHIVGTIFDRVVKEGVVLEPDNPGQWGAQAMDLAPAQGGLVEFTLAEDGLYPFVTHAFNYVGRGALGLFQAGDGDPQN